MNFYGHAALAVALDEAPGYVLGSMLPDFEGMCRERLVHADDASIRRGIALHHATDEVFHAAPEFVAITSEALAALTERGLSRGSARATAHVGTELLLDAYLLRTRGPNEGYLRALEQARRDALGASLRFRDGGSRFESLRGRLHAFGMPHAYGDATFVAERLANALAARPRLALRDDDVSTVADFLRAFRPTIEASADALLDRVERSVRATAGAHLPDDAARDVSVPRVR